MNAGTKAFLVGCLIFLALISADCSVPPIRAPRGALPVRVGTIRAEKMILTWKDLRDRNVVLQSFDYSCGAGALATLLRYYFGEDVSEEEILLRILAPLGPEEISAREKNGLSLLDLKLCAERLGYQAVAAKLTYAALSQLKGPILIHLERDNYRHFAVLKGVRGDRVYLADPSRGNVRISLNRFAEEWTGAALILGKQGFGLPQDYPLALDEQQPVQNEVLPARRSLYVR